MTTANRCFRCKEAPGAYASRDSVANLYCADCFSTYCVTKCRDQALTACALPCDTPIAVAVSGGCHSLFLLNQLGALRRQYNLYQGKGHMEFVLLPFMLREDALVPPLVPSASPMDMSTRTGESAHALACPSVAITHDHDEKPTSSSTLTSPQPLAPSSLSASPRDEAAAQLRADMLAQFDRLERITRDQMSGWTFAGQPLFTASELRVFGYEDFLYASDTYEDDERYSNRAPSAGLTGPTLETLHALLHHPRLSLSQREEIHELVRSRVLRLAAVRVTREWRQGQHQKSQQAVDPCSPSVDAKAATPQAQPRLGRDSDSAVDARQKDQSLEAAGRREQWVYLATGEGVDTCAARGLAALVSGRGGASMTQACGPRAYTHATGVVTIRPVSALVSKEVVLYNRLHGLEWGYSPSLSTATALRSTRRTLETFVAQLLQSGFRTAVFNVLHTAAKLEIQPRWVAEVLTPSAQRAEDASAMTAEQEQETLASQVSPEGSVKRRKSEARTQKKSSSRAGARSAELSRDQLLAWHPPRLIARAQTVTNSVSAAVTAAPHRTLVCLLCGTPDKDGSSTMEQAAVPTRQPPWLHTEATQELPPNVKRTIAARGEQEDRLLVCRGCALLLKDLSAASQASSSTIHPTTGTAATGVVESSRQSRNETGRWGTHLLRLMENLTRASALAEGTECINGASARTGRRGELSDEDRAAFLLPGEGDGVE